MTAKTNTSSDIGDQVMQQIHSQKITMRPRAYFVLGSLLLGFGFAAATIAAIIFISIITHHIRAYAPHQYLHFGTLGIRPFMFNIPWMPLILSIIGIVGGIGLLKKYDISYKRNFAGLVISLITAIILLALFIDMVGINNQLQRVKPMRGFYLRQFVDQEFAIGQVQEVYDHLIQVAGPEGYSYDLIWNEGTILPHGSEFQSGDMIRAVGKWDSDATFSAIGIVEGPMHAPPAFKNLKIKGDKHQRRHMQ